jgi:hypothetical protein
VDQEHDWNEANDHADDGDDLEAYEDDLAAQNAVEDAKYDFPPQEEPPEGYYDRAPNVAAETVRHAAALMSKRADAATDSPWQIEPDGNNALWIQRGHIPVTCLGDKNEPSALADAEHIASWQPADARAIAGLLGHIADDMHDQGAREETEGVVNGPSVRDENGHARPDWGAALGAARVYLSEKPAPAPRPDPWAGAVVGSVSPTGPAELGTWLRALPLFTTLKASLGPSSWQLGEGLESGMGEPREFPALIATLGEGAPVELTEGHPDLDALAEFAPFTVLALGEETPF